VGVGSPFTAGTATAPLDLCAEYPAVCTIGIDLASILKSIPVVAATVATMSMVGDNTYGYDSFNRLVSMSNPSGQLYSYAYDRYGNRWSQSALQGGFSFNQPFSASTNQITATGFTYDAAGNLTSDGSSTYAYDAEGNLLQQNSGGNQQLYLQRPEPTSQN